MLERRVLIMAGGTGGHVIPALSVAEVLRGQQVVVHWLGTEHGIENRLVTARGITLHRLSMAGIRGRSILHKLAGLVSAVGALVHSLRLLISLRPHCVLGMGGYASGPGGVAAWMLRIPLVLHEQNAVAGTTNRLLRRFATRLFTAYPNVLGPAGHHCGNPVRDDIAALPAPQQRFAERKPPLRLLVLGGSQGARFINQLLPQALAAMAEAHRPELWHQTGSAELQSVLGDYRKRNINCRCEAFIEDMGAAYGWADVVLCRAGALTVWELAAAGLGGLFIPLPGAIDDHQTANARWLVEAGAGELLPQERLDAEALAVSLTALDSRRCKSYGEAARACFVPDAAQVIAGQCLEVARV